MSGKTAVTKVEEMDPIEGMRRVYVEGSRPDLRVPFREIELQPTRLTDGRLQANDPVRVYDTSGPWGDPDFAADVRHGLPAVRAAWIEERGDTETYDGRKIRPEDNGLRHGQGAVRKSFPAGKGNHAGPGKDPFPSCTMPARERSRRKWNLSRSAKT